MLRTSWGTRLIALSGVVALSAVSLAAPVAADSHQRTTIGVLSPLTGDVAADGQEMLDAITLGAKTVNAGDLACGYQLDVVSQDVQDSRPDAVSSGAERLIDNDNVHMIMTGYAGPTNFEIDIMADAGMPYIIAAGSPQTRDIISKDPDRYNTVWSLSPSYDAYETDLPVVISGLIEAGQYTPRNKSLYIVSTDNPYSTGIAEGLKRNFEAIGWTVKYEDIVPTGPINDWRTILAKIRSEDPDLIVNTDYIYQNGALFTNQFMENPTESLLFIQYAPQVPEFIDLAGETSNGVLYNVLITALPGDSRAEELSQAFKDEYGRDHGIYGLAMQEAVFLYADAICEVGDPTDREAISAYIGSVEKDSSLGTIAFDQDTHLAVQDADHMPILFYQINDGERTLIWPPNFQDGDFVLPSHIDSE
jgi:branched-chain amino acid transport system substrate-binding protein